MQTQEKTEIMELVGGQEMSLKEIVNEILHLRFLHM
jgi:hypothetical protein